MPPSPIPAPLPAWAKAALWLEPVIESYLWDLLTNAHSVASPPALEWRRVQCTFANTVSNKPEDRAAVSFDLANITGGDIDASWTPADYTTCETALDAFWNDYRATMCNFWKLDSYRWYRRSFNDYSHDKPFVDSGPPSRVTTKSLAGTGTNWMPTQVSITLTEKTAMPKHWGRSYLPTPSQLYITSGGVFQNSYADQVADSARTLYAALAAAEFPMVVPVTQVDKASARGLLTVSSLQVDNIPDIIRRRRWSSATYRSLRP